MFRTIAIVSFLLVSTQLLAASRGAGSTTPCERLEAQRDRIYQQLRRPHGASRANQLHARLRELDSRIAHGCR